MVSYTLKSKTEGKESALSVIITKLFKSEKFNDRLKISLGVSVAPELIGEREENFRFDLDCLKRKKSSKALSLVKRIADFERNISLTEQFFQVEKRIPSKGEFRDKLYQLLDEDGLVQNKIKTVVPDEEIYFDSFVASFINSCIDNSKRVRDYRSQDTIAKYKVNHKHLVKYQLHNKVRLKMDELINEDLIKIVDNVNYINMFSDRVDYKQSDLLKYASSINIAYFLKVKKRKSRNPNGISETTARNVMSNLKTFVKQAQKKKYILGINLNDDSLNYKISPNAKAELFYTNELLEKIYDFQPKSLKTKLAKEYILIAALTGMRYQSVVLLKDYKLKELFNQTGEKFYAITNMSRKTGNELLSPIFKPVGEIYKFHGKFPDFPDLVTLNTYIRQLFKEMNISDLIKYVEHIYGGEIIETKKLVADVASSHDNRGSFITNLNLLDVDPLIVKKMTHEHIYERSSHQIYLKRSMDDLAIQFYNKTKNLKSRVYTYL